MEADRSCHTTKPYRLIRWGLAGFVGLFALIVSLPMDVRSEVNEPLRRATGPRFLVFMGIIAAVFSILAPVRNGSRVLLWFGVFAVCALMQAYLPFLRPYSWGS